MWDKTYIDDLVERNKVRNELAVSRLATSLCSSIGSLTNPARIANTLESVQKMKIDSKTVSSYIDYLENAFLFESAERYDVKGRRYYETNKKYYCIDIGLRNCLNLLRKKHYKESFGNFEVLFGCFRQVSAVETERFLLSQLAESPQK